MWTLVFLIAGVIAALAQGSESGRVNAGEVMHRITIDDEREIVVSKGPQVPVEVVKGLTVDNLSDRVSAFFTLDVVLNSKEAAPLILWSQTYPLHGGGEYEAFGVLDATLAPGRVIVVLASPLSSVSMLEVNLYGEDRVANLRARDWSLLAAALPTTPGRLGATVEYAEETGELRVEVVDHVQHTKQHTVLRQVEDEWRFEPVQQWTEAVKERVDVSQR